MPIALPSTTTTVATSSRPSNSSVPKPSTCNAAKRSGAAAISISTSGTTTSPGRFPLPGIDSNQPRTHAATMTWRGNEQGDWQKNNGTTGPLPGLGYLPVDARIDSGVGSKFGRLAGRSHAPGSGHHRDQPGHRLLAHGNRRCQWKLSVPVPSGRQLPVAINGGWPVAGRTVERDGKPGQ